MSEGTKTTVYLDADDYRRLQALARREGRPTAALVREAVAQYAATRAPSLVASSVGAGHSKRGNVSVRAEKLLKGFGREK